MGKDALGAYDEAKELISDSIINSDNEKVLEGFAETKIGKKIDDKIKEKIQDRYSGMSGARIVKRKDRKDDRDARKDAGLKGKEKRLARKAQRKNRKSAFKDFKDNLLDEAYVDITNLEN